MLVPVQFACVVTVQVLAAAQQEPVTGGGITVHGFGMQMPAWVQVLAPAQFACVVNVQVPARSQQEPVGWTHGFGVQTPAWVQVPVQFACMVTVQIPAGAQQDPVGGVALVVVAGGEFDNPDQFGTASAVFNAK